MRTSARAPVFRVECAPIRLRVGGQDRITAVAASHGTVWAGTERGRLFRYDGGTGEMSEARGALGGGCAVARIYPDARTRAALVFLRNADAFHARAVGPLRPRWIARLRGMRVAAAAWVPFDGTVPRQTVLLGTTLGSLFALTFDERNERDDAVAKLWAAPGGECIDGIRVEKVAAKFVAIVATRSRLYVFFDADTLDTLFREQHVSAVQRTPQGTDASDSDAVPFPSELQFMTGNSALASRRFVWAASAGVTHAQLAVRRRRVPKVADAAPVPSAVVASVVDKATIAWGTLKNATGSAAPISCNLTAFHVLVLYPASVYAFNQISGALTQRLDVWSPNSEFRVVGEETTPEMEGLLGAPAAGFARDVANDVLWVFSEDGQLARIVAGDGEHREAWQAAQQVGRFDLAMALAPLVARSGDDGDGHAVASTRQAVLRAQAEHAADAGNWEAAARLFAKTDKPVEEVILAIVDACTAEADAEETKGKEAEAGKDEGGAVMSAGKRAKMTTYMIEYLVRKLDEIEDTRHTQRTLLATALVQLYAGRISGEVAEKAREETRKDFSNFLVDRYSDLDIPTALAVLARHNCLDEAKALSKLAAKPRYALQSAARRLCVHDAVSLLDDARAKRDADKINDAVSTLSHSLVHVAPGHIAATLAKVYVGNDGNASAPVDHIRLLSALARTARSAAEAQKRKEAYDAAASYVKSVLGVVETLGKDWHELVKFLFALHVEFREESAAEASFAEILAPQDFKAPLSAELADTLSSVLRACLSARFRRLCVSLYLVLGLHDAAISLALDIDVRLAETTLAGVSLPRGKLHTLWRRVAARSDDPVAVVARSGGVLHVEDVLKNMDNFEVASEGVKTAVATELREHRRVAQKSGEEALRALEATDKLRADLAYAMAWRKSRMPNGKLSCGHPNVTKAEITLGDPNQCPQCGDDTIDSLDRPFEDPRLDLPVLGL